jgi:anthranilate/para-aminobenzoate synthase component II
VYGLKEGTDIRFLENLEVIQVCLGLFQVQIHFVGGSVSIEGKFIHEIAEGSVSVTHERGTLARGSRLERLLGARVKQARVIANGTTSLVFSNGDRILVFDDSEQCEAYQINTKQGALIV